MGSTRQRLLATYEDQAVTVERGFRFLKGLSFLVTYSRDGTTLAIQNIGEFHLRALRSMGSAYERIYFSG